MRSRSVLLVALAVVLVAFPAFGASKWPPERLAAPIMSPVVVEATQVCFDWTDVFTLADDTVLVPKYSVDIYATVTYFDIALDQRVVAEVKLSFGTSDRADGGEMGDSDLCISNADLFAAVVEELGQTPENVAGVLLEGMAKVKALDPGKGKGPQNHPFSDPVAFTVVLPNPAP